MLKQKQEVENSKKKKKVTKKSKVSSKKGLEKLEQLAEIQDIEQEKKVQWGGQNKIEIEPTPMNLARMEKYAGIGLNNTQIGAMFGASKKTLERRCKESPLLADALCKGRAIGVNNMAIGLHTIATESKDEKTRLKAIEFFLRTKGGFSEKTIHEVIPRSQDEQEEEGTWMVEVIDEAKKIDYAETTDD